MTSLSLKEITGIDGKTSVEPGSFLIAPGNILQVQTAFSGPARQTISSTIPVLIDGLNISISPYKADSIILIQTLITGSLTHVNSIGILKNLANTVSTIGQTNSNEPNMQVTTYFGDAVNTSMRNSFLTWSEVAGSTLQRTYSCYTTSGWSGTTYTTHINNRNENNTAAFSYMIAMEIGQ
jgi:hypothetical protein